jgi:hypothetical protein
LRKHFLHLVLIPATLALLRATPVAAQELLSYPLSARVISMGQAGAADNLSPSTIVLNPANVIGAPRLYAQGMMVTTDLGGNSDYWLRRANAGSSWKLGKTGAVMLGLDASYSKLHASFSYDFTTQPQTLDEDVLGLAAGVGFASGHDDFLIGVGVKRYSESEKAFDYYSGEGVSADRDAMAFDAGLEARHRATLQGWDVNSALGVAMVNAGNDIEGGDYGPDHLPRQFNFGLNVRMVSPTVEVLSARVPLIAFCASLDAMQPRDEDWVWMAGTELSVAQIFFLRNGIQTFTGHDNPDPSLATWGAGVGIPAGKLRARLDYGRRDEFLGKLEHFELTLEWTL